MIGPAIIFGFVFGLATAAAIALTYLPVAPRKARHFPRTRASFARLNRKG